VNGRLAASLVAMLSLLAAAAWLQGVRDRLAPADQSEPTLYFTARLIDRMAFAHRPLVADLYWIRSIQYFGGQRRRIESEIRSGASPADVRSRVGYDLLYPLLDITTMLDPLFNIAYRFGAIFLSSPYPQGAGRPDQAVALLEKAARVRPDKWEYLHDIGFVYYWDVHDYPKAAEYLNRAADVPGAPWWLRAMAATTLAKGGQRSTSRMLWRQMYDTAADDTARRTALLRLRQLDAIDRIEMLQQAVTGFLEKSPGLSPSWQALAAARIVPGIPLDPAGTPYVLSPDGRVSVSTASPLFPLPVEPAPRDPVP
jgi:tetratricopeptide (TPR) repeat protein